MYKLTTSANILRVSDGAHIPADPDNRDYADYLAWVDTGNVPAAADVAPFVRVAAEYLDTVRATRELILNRLSGIGFAAAATGDTVTAQGVVAARQMLLDITKAPVVLAATDIESLKGAVVDAYHAIILAAPTTIRKAFAEGGV